MVLVRQRTKLKNRIHANLAKYGLEVGEATDIFGVRGRRALAERLEEMPAQTQYATRALLEELDQLSDRIRDLEGRMEDVFGATDELERVRTLPGVGFILGVVILSEVGDVQRFPSARHLASYAGMTPRVHASGGHTRLGRTRPDVNHYLKWAYAEAANASMVHRHRHPGRHVSRLYERVKRQRGHPKAIGAVGRHLAEATYWMLKNREPYRDPATDRAPGESKRAT